MLDLLNLPGIKPVDIHNEGETLIVVAALDDVPVPLCEDCGVPMYKHGTRTSKFSDIPLYTGPVRLEVRRPRFRCETCGKMVMPQLSFLDDKRRATRRLVELIQQQCLDLTFRALAERTGVAVNTVKNIAHDLIAELEQEVRFETPVIMGIGTINLADGERCVITNLVTHNVVEILEGCTQPKLKQFLAQLPDREKVQWVCSDAGQSLKRVLQEQLLQATLVSGKHQASGKAADSPAAIVQSYVSDMAALTKLSAVLGKGYNYEITRAKVLYSAEGRKVGSSLRPDGRRLEYGPHIPTLLEDALRSRSAS